MINKKRILVGIFACLILTNCSTKTEDQTTRTIDLSEAGFNIQLSVADTANKITGASNDRIEIEFKGDESFSFYRNEDSEEFIKETIAGIKADKLYKVLESGNNYIIYSNEKNAVGLEWYKKVGEEIYSFYHLPEYTPTLSRKEIKVRLDILNSISLPTKDAKYKFDKENDKVVKK